jgi:hypothetical protein
VIEVFKNVCSTPDAAGLFGQTREPQALREKRHILRSAKWHPFLDAGQAV